MIIKRVGVMSVARIAAAIYGVFGLIAGLVFSLAALAGAGMSREVGEQVSWLGPMFGLGAIIALPVLYYVFGFLGGAVGAWVFNNVSRATGGLEIEVGETV
jgi:uncharacterized membrane protein